jgi:hypothetical protein
MIFSITSAEDPNSSLRFSYTFYKKIVNFINEFIISIKA